MGNILTDSAIAAAIRKIRAGHKTAITLTDAAPSGAGRLLLVVKPDRAEWYARHFAAGRKRLIKLGTYPPTPLAEARALFAGAQLPVKAGEPASLYQSIGAMFQAYVASLDAAGKPAAKQARSVLEAAAVAIDPGKPANKVTPADIVGVIKPVYDRGARVQADKYRVYMGRRSCGL